MDKKYFENMIERIYPQEGHSRVPAKSVDLRDQTEGNWEPIVEILLDWERRGIVSIVRDPGLCNPDDICIVFNKFFDGTEFPEFWIRD